MQMMTDCPLVALCFWQVLSRAHSGTAPAMREDYVCPSLPSSELSEDWEGEQSSEDKGVWCAPASALITVLLLLLQSA